MQVTEFAELIWHDQMEEVREALKDEGNLQPFRDYINTLFNNPSPNDEGVDIQLALAQRVLKILDNEGPLAEDAQKLACAAWEALPNSSVSTSFKGLATDLVKHGVDVASLAPNHEHPLFLAIEEGHWGMVHELLESKITELPMQDVEHLSLLTLAAHALFEALTPGVSKADPSRARWIRMIIEELTDAIPDEAFNIADSIDELSLWLLMHPDLEIEDSTLIKILSKLPDERLKEKSKDQMTLIHKAALLPGTSPDFFKALVERYQKDGLKPILSTHASKFGTVAQMMASFGFRPENLATLLRARFDEDQNSALDEELRRLAQSIARKARLPETHLLRPTTGGIALALCCGMYDKARQIINFRLAVDKETTLSQLAARFGCLEWILQGAYLPKRFLLSPLHDNIEVKRQTEKLIAELLLDHPFHETWLANPDPEHSFLYLAAKNGWHSLAAQIWRKLSDRHIQAIRDQFW
ncbi:MAG: hypothetical protein KDK78_10005, partial [Chlamydiia bacterium]|nr:hypothetical protein [Chlamydiia bacterium]